jgi:hypothetical protein
MSKRMLARTQMARGAATTLPSLSREEAIKVLLEGSEPRTAEQRSTRKPIRKGRKKKPAKKRGKPAARKKSAKKPAKSAARKTPAKKRGKSAARKTPAKKTARTR